MEEIKIDKIGKTLIVSPVLHKTLLLMKINGDFNSLNDLISDLVNKANDK
jgi:hypothetical protein